MELNLFGLLKQAIAQNNEYVPMSEIRRDIEIFHTGERITDEEYEELISLFPPEE